MLIPCDRIAAAQKDILRARADDLCARGIRPHLVTILVGGRPDQASFVRIKERVAHELHISFTLRSIAEDTSFSDFLSVVGEVSQDPETSALIIQQPIPTSYDLSLTYEATDPQKEIEGFHPMSPFVFPLTKAVLSGLKYVLRAETHQTVSPEDAIISFPQDKVELSAFIRDKHVVIMGRGITGGAPIARMLRSLGNEPAVLHSQTDNAPRALRSADIIITAVGKHVLSSHDMKPGVIVLNVGLRRENGTLRGDYDEADVAPIAAWHTKTPGGLGPLDVYYLFDHVLTAAASRR